MKKNSPLYSVEQSGDERGKFSNSTMPGYEVTHSKGSCTGMPPDQKSKQSIVINISLTIPYHKTLQLITQKCRLQKKFIASSQLRKKKLPFKED